MAPYKYIYFRREPSRTKAQVWACFSARQGAELGCVKWYSAWRQYCFFPNAATLFSKHCMHDIGVFIDHLMEERK